MKRLVIVASLFVFAACAPKTEDAAPADAAHDMSTMTDSTMTDSTMTDSTMMDSTMVKADSTMKKM